MSTSVPTANAATLPTRAQAVTAWLLAHAFGHLWATLAPRPKAVAALTAGKPFPLGGLDPDGIGGIESPTFKDGVFTHTSGSGSVAWTIDRKGVARATVRLRAQYPDPCGSGPVFARVEVDRRTGRVEVEADGLRFENHLGTWRFAPATPRTPARPVVTLRRTDALADHADGVLSSFLRAFGLQSPGHIARMVKEIDEPAVAAYNAKL